MEADSLRALAESWSLAGDRQLLTILQHMHQKVVTRAHETSSKMAEMMSSIDNAGVSLQNVNNSLMALSSKQFIESRVYEDADHLTSDTQPQRKVEPRGITAGPPSEQALAASVAVLKLHHEEICVRVFSDSDSDSDGGLDGVVLKAKDLYPSRPLPHTIGTSAWKEKWHAGLIEEDSDSDSDVVKQGEAPDQYSSSSEEEEVRGKLLSPSGNRKHQESFTSEEIAVSDEESLNNAGPIAESEPQTKQSQSEFAADLARRLAAGGRRQEEIDGEEEGERETVATGWGRGRREERHMFSEQVQRQLPPVAGAIFSEEPPPLLAGSSDDDDDMFPPTPPTHANRPPPRDAPEGDLFQKPAGAVSLFGSKKDAESIGAAILKRNQRESSSFEDDRPSHRQEYVEPKLQSSSNDEEVDIFDDLFAKSEKESKKFNLNDDIFDDIDDIFSTDIVSKVPIKDAIVTKCIFDDDDLFADVDVVFEKNEKVTKTNVAKSESDLIKKESVKAKPAEFKNLFDGDDTDNDVDNLFADIKVSKDDKVKSQSLFEEDDDEDDKLFNTDYTNNDANTEDKSVEQKEKHLLDDNVKSLAAIVKSPSLFEDDDDTDNLFEKSLNTNKSVHMEKSCNDSTANVTEIKAAESASVCANVPNKTPVETPLTYEETQDLTQLTTDENDISIGKTTDEFNVQTNKSADREVNKVVTEETSSSMKHNKIQDEDVTFNRVENIPEDADRVCEDKSSLLIKQDDSQFQNIDSYNNDAEIDFNKSNNTFDTKNTDAIDAVNQINVTQNKNSSISSTDVFSDVKGDFDDLFTDQPPDFEKPKEIKKSKNINALFDDDSDDEALFFKKDDHLFDKPDDFLKKDEDSLPFIFHDEPPAINVDLTEKVDNNDDIFTKKTVNTGKSSSPSKTILDETPIPIEHVTKENTVKDINKIVEPELKSTAFSEQRVSEHKKPIGKIKSNISINVNTLLPGASPKKTVKITDSTDRTDARDTTKSNITRSDSIPNFNTKESAREVGSKFVKSASFEDNPDSSVLCNKVSKDRAKIQVKRRPSTRRARKDAIQKSCTDSDLNKTDCAPTPDDVTTQTMSDDDTSITTLGKVYTKVLANESGNSIKTETQDAVESVKNVENTTDMAREKTPDKELFVENVIERDETEIFKSVDNPKEKRKLQIEDSDDDIFKSTHVLQTKNIVEDTSKVNVESKVEEKLEKSATKPKKTISLFDDSSDEELFGAGISKSRASRTVLETPPTPGEDLFASRSPSIVGASGNVKNKRPSLFGEESEADLFVTPANVKERVERATPAPATQILFQDPLSALEDPEEFV